MKYYLNYCKSSNKSCSLIRLLTYYLLITNKLFPYNYVMTLGLENYFVFRLMPGDYFTARGRCEEVEHYACNYLHVIQVNQFIHLF